MRIKWICGGSDEELWVRCMSGRSDPGTPAVRALSTRFSVVYLVQYFNSLVSCFSGVDLFLCSNSIVLYSFSGRYRCIFIF